MESLFLDSASLRYAPVRISVSGRCSGLGGFRDALGEEWSQAQERVREPGSDSRSKVATHEVKGGYGSGSFWKVGERAGGLMHSHILGDIIADCPHRSSHFAVCWFQPW